MPKKQAKVRRMFEVPNSSMVHKIGFDPTTPGVDRGYLVVQFTNLDVWGYPDVPYFDALMLQNAESVGTAFNTLIRAKYKGEPISKTADSHIVKADDVSSKPKPKGGDELPMLDVIGSSTVGNTRRRS